MPPSTLNGGPFPDGFRVVLDPGVRWLGDGNVLVGGSPIRLLRLTPSGRDLVERLADGEPVPRSPGAQSLTRRMLHAGLAHPRPPVPATGPEVAVVIPVRDGAGGLAATLDALGAGRLTVVVDDASADPGALSTPCSRPDITLLHRPVRGGPAAARNDGWRATGAPLVAFVDANCEPAPNWLELLLPHFADPQVAAVAPRIVPLAEPGVPATLAGYEAASSPLDLGPAEATVRPRSPVAYVPTAALVVRRSALEELGGFDETLTVGEDVDFVWRLVAAGWTVRYEPRATVRHPVRPSWPAWVKQRFRYGTAAAALARRHGAAVAPVAVSPWTAAAWGLVASGHPMLGVAVAGCSATVLTARLPASEAITLAGLGHVRGGLALARALRRAWPPLAVLVASTSPRARPALAAAAVIPGLLDWMQRRPPLDALRFVGLRLADDLAYAAGVWAGCVREGSARALRPDLRNASRGGTVRHTYEPVAPIGGRA